MKGVICFLVIALVQQSLAVLYITTVPQSIKLSDSTEQLNLVDVPHVINYLMGLPTKMDTAWKGAVRMDLFSRPQANVFINIFKPDGVQFSIPKYVTKYNVQSTDQSEIPSLEETHAAINKLYSEHKPVIVDSELDGEVLSTASQNVEILNGLPSTLPMIKERLAESDSIASNLPAQSCLNPSRDADAFFLAELQTMTDILIKLQLNRKTVDDIAPDSFYFSITSLDGLVHTYGADSCEVQTATEMLESFVAKYVESFNTLYRGNLLSEVNVVGSIRRSFDQAKIRRTRSLQAVDNGEIGNLATPLPPDYPVTVNITFWVFVVFALATLAASYGIWYMDPGKDNIVYSTTPQRMKMD